MALLAGLAGAMIGRTLEHYRIVGKIAEGGMGSVYRAIDERLDRPVAVKILPEDLASDAERLARFRQEARSLAMLSHPNIVSIYEFGASGDLEYAVIELLEGETLRNMLRRGPLERPDVLDFAVQIARGLAAAHQRGVIHRDLKPENIFVTAERVVKILDFGLARQVDPAAETARQDVHLTEPGFVVGSAAYMSPEQVRSQQVDERSDVFSFGAVLYEMLTGKSAFARNSPVESMHAVLQHNPIELLADAKRDRLFAITARCLDKRADGRYASGAEVLRALEEARDVSAARIALTAPSGPEPIRSVAVLAFDDMSPARDHAYFCEGIAEELINCLATVEGLRVAARTSAFQFRGSATDARKIGAELGVDGIVEGSVRVAGDRIRVTAQLIDARNGYHVWSQRFDRSMGDVFAVQDELSSTIVDALRMRVGEARGHDSNRPPGGSLEAYDLYLRGRHELRNRQEQRMIEAVRLFEQAAEIDPKYAAALAGIAFAHCMLGYYSFAPPAAAARRACQAAERALGLSPESPEAQTMIGLVRLLFDWKWDQAAHHFQQAIALGPKNSEATGWYAFLLSVSGHQVEAVAMANRCRNSDPLSPWAIAMEGVIRRQAHDFDASNALLQHALDLQPDSLLALYHLSCNASDAGHHAEAVGFAERLAEVAGEAVQFLVYLAGALARAGREDEAARVEERILVNSPGPYFSDGVALWLAAARKSPDAAALLERALPHRSPWLVSLAVEPWFDGVRKDPRFAAALHEAGLSR